jgi:peptide deformylase
VTHRHGAPLALRGKRRAAGVAFCASRWCFDSAPVSFMQRQNGREKCSRGRRHVDSGHFVRICPTIFCIPQGAHQLAEWPARACRAGRGAQPGTCQTMALLNILHYPDKRLHKVAKPVEVVNDRIRKLVADMAETMYAAPGVGLAATQVDVHERVVVIDVSDTHNELRVFINPEIVWASTEREVHEEGCLSVPGIYDEVERAEKVRVRALNEKGETYEVDCEGLLAVCIQHEMDHLMGKVFVEYLSSLKQTRIRSKMKKLERAM